MLYPTLTQKRDEGKSHKSGTDLDLQVDNYRLNLITKLQQKLEQERDFRKTLYKKYHRGVNIVEGINSFCIVATIGTGAAGIGALTTVIGAPIALPLECVAIVCGVLGGIGKFLCRKLETKAKKHNEVYILAEAKLNTISNHISKAIEDGSITEPEFKLITDEVQKYRIMKEDIRSKTVKTNANAMSEKKR